MWQPGGRTMADTTSLWITEIYEIYRNTGNRALLQELYPQVAAAVRWQIDRSAQFGLPSYIIDTYGACALLASPAPVPPVSCVSLPVARADIIGLDVYPTATFNGVLHLLAMQAGQYLALAAGDNATAANASLAYQAGVAAMQSELWNRWVGRNPVLLPPSVRDGASHRARSPSAARSSTTGRTGPTTLAPPATRS